ncbi:Fringe protein [Hordeum vulgare]|nr:Fringe protein [Hordeum vulgare]
MPKPHQASPAPPTPLSILPPRGCPLATALLALLSLLLATALWLLLVLSPAQAPVASSSSSALSYAAADEALYAGDAATQLSLAHIVFGIAGSAHLWPRRREYVRLWWDPASMRGHVWLDASAPGAPGPSAAGEDSLPPIRVSEDTSRFRYTNPTGHPSGLRIARIAAEVVRLVGGGGGGARWVVLVDDDTVLSPDNLVAVLGKYDWREMVYVGAPSESHSANTYFSHGMAFGGGGVALSFPLAAALARTLDVCIERYPRLYGSDDRLHACITELGVPLSREYGFHQWDIRGNAHGILAAHPIAPFISIHHVEFVDPIYPGLNSLESLELFTKAMKTEPMSFLQRSVCYDKKQKLTLAISLGYVVQVYPSVLLPPELERSERTYIAFNRMSQRTEFDFDTKEIQKSMCKKPALFFLKDVWKDGNITRGSYIRSSERDDLKRKVFCFRSPPLSDIDEIQVSASPLSKRWHLAPRRLCSAVKGSVNGTLFMFVRQCGRGAFGSASDSLD